MYIKTKIKLGITIFLIAMLLIFIILNTQVIDVNFIIGKIEIRKSMMIIVTLLIGIFAGWSIRSAMALRKPKNK